MEWTIEKVKQIPKEELELLGIKRLSEGGWQIGTYPWIAWTGDGGVIDYLKAINNELEINPTENEFQRKIVEAIFHGVA